MRTRLLCLLLISVTLVAQDTPRAAQAPRDVDIATRTAGLKRADGFAPYYWDAKRGMLLFEFSPPTLDQEFLYFTALGSGVGSLDMFADRSSTHASMVCRLLRVGPRVLVIQRNTQFRATAGPPALQKSVELSFPTSVLASLPIEAETNGTVLVNGNPLIMRDVFDMLGQLRNPSRAVAGNVIRVQGSTVAWRLDNDRSVIDLEHTKNFPQNTEVEAMLTFASDQGQGGINAPDPHALTVREHHSFVALPAPGFEPRERDIRVGFFGPGFQDFSQPFNQPLDRGFIARWRLVKKDPKAAMSEPVKPITFYLDPGMPANIKAAAKRGILWWNDAFAVAGFKNAIVVEDLPDGADPLDVRYPVIQWTNRGGRGWSVGMSQSDPRTGEIIHSIVQLDSHRWRTVSNYWDALLGSPAGREQAIDMFAPLDAADPKLNEEQVMSNRLALLACHEVGHVLGLAHNFIASTFGRGSVMDYFAPRVKFHPDGSPDLSDAYMQGVGIYDKMAIEWGYSSSTGVSPVTDSAGRATQAERARLDAIAQKWNKQGIIWGPNDDPRWNAYDDGTDPVSWLKEVLPVRDRLLARYGPQLLAQGEPYENLASRFPLIYLFHRYALGAAVNVVGSAKVPPAVKGDGQKPIEIWPAESQREALNLLVSALQPPHVDAFPKGLWEYLAPTESRDPERFRSSAGYVFNQEDGVREIAAVVIGGLLDPERLQRANVLHRQDPQAPGARDILHALLTAAHPSASNDPLQSVFTTELVERIILLAADERATADVRGLALTALDAAKRVLVDFDTPSSRQLRQEIDAFFRDSKSIPRLRPTGAPPGPPI